jgi:hypothetical protein
VWENFPLKESMLIRVQKLSYPPSYMICAVSEDPWHVSFGAHRGLVQVRGSIYLSNFCRCHWSDTPEETVVIPVASRLLSPLIKLVRRRKPFTDAEYVPVYTNTKEECDAASENPDQSLDESYRRDTLATLGISEWTRGVWIYTNMCRLSDDGKSILSERGRGRSIQVDELEQLSNGTWKPGGNVPKSDSGEAKAKPERVVSPEAVMEAHETQHEMEVARDELALQA